MSETRLQSPARWQQCMSCGNRLDELDPRTSCPECGGLLDVMFHCPAGRAADLRRTFASRVRLAGQQASVSGVWRYAELLMSAAPGDVVSFPEGNTPLIPNEPVASWTGCSQLLLKHEGLNPTGSFKDRGMTVGVTQARRVRARAVACASTGNTSASLAAYARLAGHDGDRARTRGQGRARKAPADALPTVRERSPFAVTSTRASRSSGMPHSDSAFTSSTR